MNLARSKEACYPNTRFGLDGQLRATRDNFRKNLNRLMAEADLGGTKLAKAVGRTEGAISRWRSGDNEPSFEDMDRICAALSAAHPTKRRVAVYELFLDFTDPASVGLDVHTALEIIRAAVEKN